MYLFPHSQPHLQSNLHKAPQTSMWWVVFVLTLLWFQQNLRNNVAVTSGVLHEAKHLHELTFMENSNCKENWLSSRSVVHTCPHIWPQAYTGACWEWTEVSPHVVYMPTLRPYSVLSSHPLCFGTSWRREKQSCSSWIFNITTKVNLQCYKDNNYHIKLTVTMVPLATWTSWSI